jgi:DNA-binding HxlR family transcriptional regulator
MAVLGSPYRADCQTRHILDRIGDRWTVLIVGTLSEGDARFSELRRRIEGSRRRCSLRRYGG